MSLKEIKLGAKGLNATVFQHIKTCRIFLTNQKMQQDNVPGLPHILDQSNKDSVKVY